MQIRLAVAIAALITTAIQTPAAAQTQCPKVELIGIPGTLYWIATTPKPIDPTAPARIITDVANLLKPERTTGVLAYEQINDQADVGLVTSYAESHKHATEMTEARISEITKQCPRTAFAIMGYSHGAGVAGDVLRDIAMGKGPIAPDEVVTGTLFADPYREPTDPFVGPPTTPNGQGVLAPRSRDFGSITSRVRGFCQLHDLVCDNDRSQTLLTPLARHFMTENSITMIPYVLRLIQENGVDPKKWSHYLDEPDLLNLPAKVARTLQMVEEYERMDYHHWYNDPRLDVGGGQTAVQYEAARIRRAVDAGH
jgi:hypothetical protein